MSASQLPQILVGDSQCVGLHGGPEGNRHACTLVGSHDDSNTPAGCVPSNRFPFGAKPPEEAAPPELAECFSLPPTLASRVRADRSASG